MTKKRTAGEGITIDPATYNDLLQVMDELAFRGPTEEALVMRIAKVAGFTEVMTRIKRMRIYAKKHNKPRGSAPAIAANAGRKRKKKGAGAGEGENSSADS